MIKVRCPTCQKEMEARDHADLPHHPFCSQRCRLIDLGRWLDERHSIPLEEESPSTEGDTDYPP